MTLVQWSLFFLVASSCGLIVALLSSWLPYLIEKENECDSDTSFSEFLPFTNFKSFFHQFFFNSTTFWIPFIGSIFLVMISIFVLGWNSKTIISIFFFLGLLTLAIVDYRFRYLPDNVTLTVLWVGLMIQLLPKFKTVGLDQAVIGAVLGYILLWASGLFFAVLRKKRGIAHGDMKFMAMAGAWLGPHSITSIILIACTLLLFFACLIRVFQKDKSHNSEEYLAFGPYLSVATFIIYIGNLL